MSKIRKLNMISDPGHGWLSVNIKDLIALKIDDKISSYSYLNKSCVYLEEDSDASIYLNAAKEAGWKVTVTEKYQDRTAIRSYAHYSQENVSKFMSLVVGTIIYLYHSVRKNYSIQATITEIVGSKYHLKDEYGTQYKCGATRLIRSMSLVKD